MAANGLVTYRDHLHDGWWEQAFKHYRYAWIWTWPGRSIEPTVQVEGLKKPVDPPSVKIEPLTPDPHFPGVDPHNL